MRPLWTCTDRGSYERFFEFRQRNLITQCSVNGASLFQGQFFDPTSSGFCGVYAPQISGALAAEKRIVPSDRISQKVPPMTLFSGKLSVLIDPFNKDDPHLGVPGVLFIFADDLKFHGLSGILPEGQSDLEVVFGWSASYVVPAVFLWFHKELLVFNDSSGESASYCSVLTNNVLSTR